MMRHLVLSVLLAVLLDAGLESSASADPAYDSCAAAANGVMPSFADCGDAWIEREDRRLNAAWTILITKVDADTKASLLDEQRAWIAFKNKTCAFYANGFGQNGTMLSYPACRAEIIARRTEELRVYTEFMDGQ